VLALLALTAAPARAPALMEFEGDDWQAELREQIRVVGTFTREESADAFLERGSTRRQDSGVLLVRNRLTAQGAVGDRLYGQVAYDVELRTGSGLESLGFEAANEIGTRTWLDADRVFHEAPDAHMRHALYRAWLRYEGNRFDLTLGRQRIALGRGRLWNPTDLFNPIFPLAVEGDQRIGQDAALGRLRLSRTLRLVGIWSPQDDPDLHKAALRFELQRAEIDAALMTGRFQRDWVFGADFALSFRGAAIRGEATFTDLDLGDRIWQVVGSADYSYPVGTGLYLLVEHLYNENLVDPSAFAALPPGPSRKAALETFVRSQTLFLDRITTIARNQTAFEMGYDLTPILRADLLFIYDWNGPSAAIVPAITYQWRQDIEVALTAQFFVGRDQRAEYGDRPTLLVLQIDSYF
jgi:hypothetical protein